MTAQWMTGPIRKLRILPLMAALAMLPGVCAAQSGAAVSDHRLQQAQIPLGAGTQLPPK
jgi:hypothetical protein